jgi:adenosylmethionine-8-amino-7-oxononanoate aminotransferase
MEAAGPNSTSQSMQAPRCVEFVENTSTKDIFPEELGIGKCIAQKSHKHCQILRPLGDLNVLLRLLTMTKQDVNFVIGTRREIIEATMAGLQTLGCWNS